MTLPKSTLSARLPRMQNTQGDEDNRDAEVHGERWYVGV